MKARLHSWAYFEALSSDQTKPLLSQFSFPKPKQLVMSTKDGNEPLQNDVLASPTLVSHSPEPPFTIFDKHQKWLIVFIVSFAATCKSSTI
jgi:hypothetical protein